ncbi:helix-turn-helix domain-containing protein [Aquimarina muelleri]|uniref:helix-turn-helix domain-containing protein n=1 Tax=Aquimarina muelleri TaxID=279356 RepID=UPI003F68292A
MSDFGKNLKQLRTEKEYSQEAFAKLIEIHVTNLSKYERDISLPSIEVAQRMAKVLGISIDQLVYGDNKANTEISDNNLLLLFNKTQSLDDKQKSTVIELLEAFLLSASLKKQLSS